MQDFWIKAIPRSQNVPLFNIISYCYVGIREFIVNESDLKGFQAILHKQFSYTCRNPCCVARGFSGTFPTTGKQSYVVKPRKTCVSVLVSAFSLFSTHFCKKSNPPSWEIIILFSHGPEEWH